MTMSSQRREENRKEWRSWLKRRDMDKALQKFRCSHKLHDWDETGRICRKCGQLRSEMT